MFCAVASALSVIYSADFVFFKVKTFEDFSKVIKVSVNPASKLVYDYGVVFWGVLLIATVIAFEKAFRRPIEKRTLVVNLAVALVAVSFTLLLHYSAWNPVRELLIGFGGFRSSP
jgi:hypothetical protein